MMLKRIGQIYHQCIIILLLSVPLSISAQTVYVQSVAGEENLASLIKRLEKDQGLLFSYRPKDVKSIKVNTPKGQYSLDTFLDKILEGTNLEFKILDNNNVILSRPRVSDLKNNEEKFLQICGFVHDQNSGEPLAYANVYLSESQQGTTTDEKGKFELKISSDSKERLIISYVGFREKVLSPNLFQQDPCKKISLDYALAENNVVVVTEYLTDGIQLNNHAAYTEIQPSKLSVLPGQVEPDVMQSLQFLPGITSPDGSAANICIRGGSSDQNLVLWENIPVYHTAHQFGMISAFNPHITNSIQVYRGGFDASYGDRVSGVIDMKTSSNAPDQAKFGAGLTGTQAYTYGDLGTKDKTVHFVYSLRRSFAELWESPRFENINRRIHQGVLLQLPGPSELPPGIRIRDAANFFDTHAKLGFKLGESDQLSFSGFYGNNDFSNVIRDDVRQVEQSDTLVLRNHGIGLNWQRQWSAQFKTEFRLIQSSFNYDYDYEVRTMMRNPPNKLGEKKSAIRERQAFVKSTYLTKKLHKFIAGYQLSNYQVDYTISKDAGGSKQAEEERSIDGQTHAAFAQFESAVQANLGVDAGLRVTYFQKNQKTYIDPRLRIWYQATEDLNLYVKAGQYHQFLSQLLEIRGDNASIETPVWILADKRSVPVLEARQLLFGAVYKQKSWLFDLQVYAKKIKGVSSLSTGFDDITNDPYHVGDAMIRGLDILVKKRWQSYHLWASYSLNDFEYQFPTFFDETFPSPIDQRHVFQLAGSCKVGSFNFSLGWRFSSGLPYSLRENYRVDQDPGQMGQGMNSRIKWLVRSYNSERLAAIHQLDASVTYEIKPKDRAWNGILGLSFSNIYNRNNLYNRSFFIDDGPNRPARLTYTNRAQMGFTPDVLFRIEF